MRRRVGVPNLPSLRVFGLVRYGVGLSVQTMQNEAVGFGVGRFLSRQYDVF